MIVCFHNQLWTFGLLVLKHLELIEILKMKVFILSTTVRCVWALINKFFINLNSLWLEKRFTNIQIQKRDLVSVFVLYILFNRYAVESSHVVIIQGETGCGKSTQIPQYLFESGWSDGGRCVVCTQVNKKIIEWFFSLEESLQHQLPNALQTKSDAFLEKKLDIVFTLITISTGITNWPKSSMLQIKNFSERWHEIQWFVFHKTSNY